MDIAVVKMQGFGVGGGILNKNIRDQNKSPKLGLKPKATPQFGQSRSHAMNASKKMFKPNIQNKTVIIDGKKYKVKLTTREIRTLDKKGINLL